MGNEISTVGEDKTKSVTFNLYADSSDLTQYNVIVHGDINSIRRTSYNTAFPLTVLVHGFNNTFEGSFLQDTKNALLRQRVQTNVIMMDYRKFSRMGGMISYPKVVTFIPALSQTLTNFLLFLITEGIVPSPQSVHLIGESLGAHICGLAGKIMEKLKGEQISRITGLDPAGPYFQNANEKLRLCPSDASFVDVVHSNQENLGYVGAIGQVDFYLNGDDLSHAFAVELYSESILNKIYYGCGCYHGRRTCDNFDKEPKLCSTVKVFGYKTPRMVRGEYYVRAYDS